MIPAYERDGIRLYVGDCREIVPQLGIQFSAVCTDPPYGLGFMGKDWDHEVPGVAFWEAFKDAMLPGAHLLSFGGSRTYHRIAVAIEDAGFEIRDTLTWLYGQGFPKSHDVSKAIDATITHGGSNSRRMKATNASRPGEGRTGATLPNNGVMSGDRRGNVTRDTPATPEAERWQGWGTALKPAYEPIILARKPLSGTVAQNVLTHGTGAINIDACRVGYQSEADKRSLEAAKSLNGKHKYTADAAMCDGDRDHSATVTNVTVNDTGRWPANVLLDEHAAAMLDKQSGTLTSGRLDRSKITAANKTYGAAPKERTGTYEPDTGGASRFFYVAKASRAERNRGLPEGSVCSHPTVKPLALLRWLLTLVTPPGGIVLDPFVGSGSTLVACAQLGIPACGIDMNEEYIEIAARRVDHALNERAREEAKPRQLSIAD